jgi:4-alpha-glucanotransferase
MVQAQDVLGLGGEARMNLPGKARGNWRWQLEPGQLTPAHAARLRAMVIDAGRPVSGDM